MVLFATMMMTMLVMPARLLRQDLYNICLFVCDHDFDHGNDREDLLKICSCLFLHDQYDDKIVVGDTKIYCCVQD